MRCLVIGGAGYIGAHIVHDLLEKHHDIIVFDDLSSGIKENLPSNIEFIQGNVLDEDSLDSIFSKQIDVVFHFAAKKATGESMLNVKSFSQNNLSGTINILNSMVEHGVQHIIFSSTAAVYGNPQYLPIDEKHPTNPENYYGFTKLKIEEMLQWYSKIHGIKYASLRYFNAVGYDINGRISLPERDPQNLFPIIMECLAKIRDDMQVFGDDYNTTDGTCIRDYIHVNDLSQAHLSAMNYLLKHEKNICLNLGSENGFSVLESIKEAESSSKRKVNYKITHRRLGDPESLIADSAEAYKVLSWTPKYSQLNTIMDSMWNIYSRIGQDAVH